MPSFFDTHSHIDLLLSQSNEPLSVFKQKCSRAKVSKIMLMGVYKEQFKDIIQLAHNNDNLFYCALGLHPCYILQHCLEDLSYLSLLINNNRCIALGEIGLDKFMQELTTPEKWQLQCAYFEAQLNIAEQFKLPVCIHARYCHNEIYSFIKKYSITGIIHGFSGSYQEAKRYVDLGFKIGVGGVITYPRATKTRKTISQLPMECLVLETDAPDMPIYQQQENHNHPQNIPLIFASLQSLLNIDKNLLIQQLWQNSIQVFNLEKIISHS